METDETIPEGVQEEQNTEVEDSTEETTEQSDYQAKLNATNRFLKKEGYEFKEGKWQREEKEEVKPQEQSDNALSTKDLYALMQAQVPEEDVEEVVKASKLLGVSIGQALKDTTVQNILKTRDEHRKTAQATNTGKARTSTKQVTDQELLKQASAGKLPEEGTAEAEQLFWARRGGKRE